MTWPIKWFTGISIDDDGNIHLIKFDEQGNEMEIPDLIDSCATTSFSTHVPDHLKEAALTKLPKLAAAAGCYVGIKVTALSHSKAK